MVNLPLLKRIGQPCAKNRTTHTHGRETEWRRTYNCWTSSDSLVYRADTCAVTSDMTKSLLFWNTHADMHG